MIKKSIALVTAVAGFACFGIAYLSGCSSTNTSSTTIAVPNAPPSPSANGTALLVNADTLVSQLQSKAPAIMSSTGAGPKTTADVTAGLWAAKVIIQALQGQPVTAADLDTGIPAVNSVLQANLGSGNATAKDVQTITSVIAKIGG